MIMYIIWLGLAGLILIAGIAIWLKDTWSVISELLATLRRRSGEPWTWMVFFEPIAVAPFALMSAAFGLARPDSRWAGWFYGSRRMGRARARYGDIQAGAISPR